MQCPICQADNPPTAVSCLKCTTPLPFTDQTLGGTGLGGTSLGGNSPGGDSPDATSMGNAIPGGTAAWSVAVTQPTSTSAAQGEQLVGTLLADRYEIISLLGQGGMGAVYKAHDTELERLVAIKLIRPDLASNPEILRRFKQELILAREVTHRNVIRIFDLGQAKGFKFITMEFVEGRDLRAVLRERGKLPPEEAVRIISQVCRALESAHAAGVVHRDLKPQNIMLDAKDRVYVMDFGIAHSLETPGMTQTGALMGTPEYMSPEQAKGIKVDARSDLFALGIILYELLTGVSPYKADNALAMLLKRTQERPQPPAELDPTIPKPISDVVMKCLEIDRDQRYSNAREILEDLGLEMPTSVRTVAPTLPPSLPAALPKAVSPFLQYRSWMIGGAAVLLFAILGFAFRSKIFSGKRGGAVEQASLAILPFRNATGDPSLNWIGVSLAEMLRTDVGQSAEFHTVSPERLQQILADLRINADTEFAATDLQQVAAFTNANMLVSGQYVRLGGQIRIDAKLEDLKRQRTVPFQVNAPSENALVNTVDQLAQSIQANLALGSSAVKELKAAAFKPSSTSLEAIRDFTQGLQLARQGNHIEAVKQFEAATKADSNFALAFSMLAQTYTRLGYDKQAQQNATRSVELSANLSPAEKYMIQAANARIGNNYQNALDAYNKLVELMPNDAQVQFELGELYEQHGVYDQAHAHFAKALESDPKHIDALRGIGQVEYQRGNPQGSLDYLNRALSLAVELNNRQGKAGVLHDLGEAYRLLNRPQDALQNFQQSLDIKQQIGDKQGMAVSLDEIATTYGLLGKSAEAEKTFQQELSIRKDIDDQVGMGVALISLGAFLQDNGRYEEALSTTKQALQIELQLGHEPNQAACLANIGWMYFQLTKYDDALMYQQRAGDLLLQLKEPSEIAANLNNLGLTYARIGQFDPALKSYLQALDEARKVGDKKLISAISDGLADLFLIQGRYGAALNAQQDALKNAEQLEQQMGTYGADVKADYGNVLNHLGRGEEAQKVLGETLNVAHSARDDALASKILNFQGEGLYYRGDLKSAGPQFAQAQQSATKAKDRIQVLTARFNLARVSVKEGHAATAVNTLKSLFKEADSLGVKYLATECSIALGEAFLGSKDYSHAQDELQSAVRKSEDLGMKSLLPEGHYLLSQALRKRGSSAEADNHVNQAAQLLDQMRQESHSDTLLQRFDLKPIVDDTRK